MRIWEIKTIERLNYKILPSKKKGIPHSRNIFIKFLKKKNYKFAGFLDDDCVVHNNWLCNMIKFYNHQNCDIIGGPKDMKLKIQDLKTLSWARTQKNHGELLVG